MTEYQTRYQQLHRAIDELDRCERGTYGRRAAIGELVRAIDNLILARVNEILGEKGMDELEQLAKELAPPKAAE